MNQSIKYTASDVDLQQSIYIKEGNNDIAKPQQEGKSQSDVKIIDPNLLETKPIVQDSKESLAKSKQNIEKQQAKLTKLHNKAKP